MIALEEKIFHFLKLRYHVRLTLFSLEFGGKKISCSLVTLLIPNIYHVF